MLQSLDARDRRLLGIGLFVMVLVSWFTFASVRRYATYRTVTDVEILKVQVRILQDRLDEKDRVAKADRDELWKTIYELPGTVTVPPARRASGIEQWQINRDKKYDDRISALEAWRFKVEK